MNRKAPAQIGTRMRLSEAVLNRAGNRTRRNTAGALLLAASLDLMVWCWRLQEMGVAEVRPISKFAWQINSTCFIYLREDDDGALDFCVNREHQSPPYIVVPPQYGKLKIRLVKATLQDRVTMLSLGEYVETRLMWALLDNGWKRRETEACLLTFYNRRVSKLRYGNRLVVQAIL